jgi:hypothetical protein
VLSKARNKVPNKNPSENFLLLTNTANISATGKNWIFRNSRLSTKPAMRYREDLSKTREVTNIMRNNTDGCPCTRFLINIGSIKYAAIRIAETVLYSLLMRKKENPKLANSKVTSNLYAVAYSKSEKGI